MNTGPLITRYAAAYLDYAIELDQQQMVYTEMKTLLSMFSEVKEFAKALDNPAIQNSQKMKLIETAVGSESSQATDRFIKLLFKNKRETHLRSIAYRYLELYRQKFSIKRGKLITATKVNKETYVRMKSFIEQKIGENVDLERIIDPSILGGFIIQVGDNVIDASISGQLNQIRNDLTEMNLKKKVQNI